MLKKLLDLVSYHFLFNADSWFQDEIKSALTGVEIEWVKPESNEGDKGIVRIEFVVNKQKIVVD